jgi:hypothetical protein
VQLAATVVFRQRKHSQPHVQPVRNIRVYFDSNFAAAALCLYYPGESDEVIQVRKLLAISPSLIRGIWPKAKR